MRIAIAHEWIAARAGSEKVFEELAAVYPDADLYALTNTPGVHLETAGREIHTTFLDRLGPYRERRALMLPFMPAAWRYSGRGISYDKVITSSHACVKGFWPGRSAQHFCYVHAPMRYVWNPDIDARGAAGLLAPAREIMAHWDKASIRWVDSFAANSSAVADRINTIYGRDARVIHPPVDVDFFAAAHAVPRSGFVTLGRLIPYKGHDIAIRVAAELGVPLTIIGRGPEEDRLRSLGAALGANVRFLVGVEDETVRSAVAGAAALLFPANEDFGIVPVEAQAAGTPVVGPSLGGLLDTVVPGRTGELAEEFTVPALAAAAERVLTGRLSAEDCRRNAARFSSSRFRREVREWVGS